MCPHVAVLPSCRLLWRGVVVRRTERDPLADVSPRVLRRPTSTTASATDAVPTTAAAIAA